MDVDDEMDFEHLDMMTTNSGTPTERMPIEGGDPLIQSGRMDALELADTPVSVVSEPVSVEPAPVAVEPPTVSVAARIGSFGNLDDGWLDGEVVAPSAKTVRRSVEIFRIIDKFAPVLPRPATSPMEDGEITLEWSVGPWEVSIDVIDETMSLHAINVDTDEEMTGHISWPSPTTKLTETAVRCQIERTSNPPTESELDTVSFSGEEPPEKPVIVSAPSLTLPETSPRELSTLEVNLDSLVPEAELVGVCHVTVEKAAPGLYQLMIGGQRFAYYATRTDTVESITRGLETSPPRSWLGVRWLVVKGLMRHCFLRRARGS